MKVLLVYPENRNDTIEFGDEPWIGEPLALEYLAAGLKPDGHEIKILDLRLHPNGLETALKEFQPEVVGLTGYSVSVLRNMSTCLRIKEILPECKTVMGGHHATMMPEDYFQPQVDFIISGEGVFPMKRLVQNLSEGKTSEDVPGVWTRTNGHFQGGAHQKQANLDSLPFPDRTITGEDRKSYYIEWVKKPIAFIRATAGCSFRCSFCTVWKEYDGKYFIRRAERIVEELKKVQEDLVLLIDDEPFLNPSFMGRLAKGIKEEGIKKQYMSFCRADSMIRNPDLMRAWREIGLSAVFMGIEASTEQELIDYNKRLELNQILEALNLSKSIGINILSGFIVHPSYLPKNFRNLARFIERNNISNPSFSVATPLPGSDEMKDFSTITEFQPNGRPNWDLWDIKRPVVKTALPKDQFMKEFEKLKREFGTGYGQYKSQSTGGF